VGTRARLDGCGKSRPPLGFDPLNRIILDLIKFFKEIPRWLKIPMLLQTALATIMHLAEGLALAQETAVNIELCIF